ncbi:MAG: nuclear transport factor 2 family protein [Hyphomonadaceae bacterium]
MSLLSPIAAAVTGGESLRPGDDPFNALVEFYLCFNHRDLRGLSQNWLCGAEPSMDNPIGGIRRGWDEIRAGYDKLFNGPARIEVEFHDYTQQRGEDWCLFVGRERGSCVVGGETLALAIRTTRWFVRRDGRWLQLHHHGSIEKAALLADYQRLIFGAPL